MNTLKLIAAISYLTLNVIPATDMLISIEFEDGSGYKFNYRLQHEKRNRYIDLTGKI